MKNLSIIVAVGKNLEIGKDNQLLWHISEDLKYFKKNTSEKTIVMGHNTWKSLPFKPLPNRKNIVLSRQKDLQIDGVTIVHSMEDLNKVLKTDEDVFIMGGATIYRHFINMANKMYITRINKNFDADTFFPEIDTKTWKKNSQSEWFTDEKTNLEYCFEIYIRN